jgi:tRNA pseudouridine38-40 synthase
MQKHFYLVKIQYLGFRFHGWAKQPNLKTVHFMIDRTIAFVLEHKDFKTLGSSRTDGLVSANESAFELFVKEPLDMDWFLTEFNRYLPTDIKGLGITEVDEQFNIINSPKIKEYLYLFSFGQKVHPFSASLMASFVDNLDVELMKQGAKLFEGTHNYKKYAVKPSANTNFTREVNLSEITENDVYTANFFPKQSFVYRIRSKGFMRGQIRMMMGQLILLGKGEKTLEDLKTSLENPDNEHLKYIADASGLILNKVEFEG